MIALVISIIVMLILAGVSINAVVGDNGILGKTQDSVYLQSIAVLQEYLQMEYSNYALDDNPYGTAYGLLNAKHPGWFYQNAQGYILDSEGHVLYLIKKSGLPEEIQKQIKGGDASKVSQYYKQKDVYGVTSDLQVYYCSNGTSTIMGLTTEDLDKDNPLEIAYDEDSLLSKVINGVGEDGKALEALSTQDLKSIKTLTIDTTEKLALLQEFKKLPSLQTVYFINLTVPTLEGMQYATNITEVRFTSCAVQDYSALCGLSKLNKLYLITPTGKNTDVATLCSSDKGIATAEFGNLKYFGIVGDATYIQSTSKGYSSTRYDITDISGLSNLSTITKQSIQYMYLQNLQLTSIGNLSDYVNITILRLEENALTTFNGIQNMSQLTYLIAPTCYSNTTSTYTIGKEETDTQNTSTDALSYIYKNDEGKNTSLYYLDIRNAQNLKWTGYLSSCSGIRYLYMDNNTAIKDVSTIANVIGNCGVNYTMSSTMTVDIISNTSVKLDLSNTTITENQFRNLKNNTSLKFLNLRGTVIISNTNTELSSAILTDLYNEVLSTCTSMVHLCLGNQPNLTNINFISNMIKLKSLDLYGCNSISDISVLESMTNIAISEENEKIATNPNWEYDGSTFKLGFLNLSNPNLVLNNIQKTISRLGEDGFDYWNSSSQTSRGVWISDAILLKKLEGCTDLTKLCMVKCYDAYNEYMKNLTIDLDLSSCALLKEVYLYRSAIKFKFPLALEQFTTGYSDCVAVDFSNCSNLKRIGFSSDYPASVLINSMNSLPDNLTKVETINISTCRSYENFEWLSKFSNCKNLDTFTLTQCHKTNGAKFKDLSGLAYLTYVKNITISYASRSYNTHKIILPNLGGLNRLEYLYVKSGNIDDISNLSACIHLTNLTIAGTDIRKVNALSNLTYLTSLSLSDNKITDITGLENLNNLTYLNLSTNNLNDIKPLENLKKLETLNLQNNALYDSSYDNTGKPYYTLTVFADLNQKQDGNLKNLYLSGNNIEDFSMLQDSNLKWDAKSGW